MGKISDNQQYDYFAGSKDFIMNAQEYIKAFNRGNANAHMFHYIG